MIRSLCFLAALAGLSGGYAARPGGRSEEGFTSWRETAWDALELANEAVEVWKSRGKERPE